MCSQTESLSVSSGFIWLIEQDINFCIRVKNFIVTNHLGKNHKISDLFRHLKLVKLNVVNDGFWLVVVKLYISALQLENGRAFTRRFSSV